MFEQLAIGILVEILLALVVLLLPFLAARRYGWWGAGLALVIPPVLVASILPLVWVLRLFWPFENYFAYGMAMGIFGSAVGIWLPFGAAAAGLGIWRRRVVQARGGR